MTEEEYVKQVSEILKKELESDEEDTEFFSTLRKNNEKILNLRYELLKEEDD